VMTRSKRIQGDIKEKEDFPPKTVNGILAEKDQVLEKVEDPTIGNALPKKEGDKKKEILTSP